MSHEGLSDLIIKDNDGETRLSQETLGNGLRPAPLDETSMPNDSLPESSSTIRTIGDTSRVLPISPYTSGLMTH